VREAIVTDTTLTSFEEARRAGDGQLAQYASVITDIQFESYVPGWHVAESVPISITEAQTGRTYDGNAVIQSLDLVWLGAQLIQYRVRCSEVRFNWFDYQLAVAHEVPDRTLGAIQSKIAYNTSTVMIVPGFARTVTQASLPYVVGPSWGAMQANVGVVGFSQIPSTNGGN
jgi:hypothetical protein